MNSFVFIILICQLFMLYFERQQIHKNYSISKNFHQPIFIILCNLCLENLFQVNLFLSNLCLETSLFHL